MHPELFRVPVPLTDKSIPVASYGAMILLGFLLCLWLLRRRGAKRGLDPNALFDAATFMLLGGIIGARLFYVIEFWENFSQDPSTIIRLDLGGLSFFGGLMGGGAALLATILARGLPLMTTLDTAAGLVPLGHAFGRMGCFLNGCCFGRATSTCVGVRFPRILEEVSGHGQEGSHIVGSLPYQHHLAEGLVTASDTHSLPVYPTQLFAVGYNLVIFGVLTYVWRHRRRPGDVGWAYLALYGTARFINEFFRGDHEPMPLAGGLTLFQLLAGTAAVVGIAMLIRSSRLPRVPLPEPWTPLEQTEPNPD